MSDQEAATLALALGLFLLAAEAFALSRLRNASANGRYWIALNRVADALDAAGFDRRFTTRGHYVNLAALAALGIAFLTAGLVGLLVPYSALVAPIGVLGVFVFGVVSAVAVVIARTGRPRSWIPQPYR